jgi:hypothetical protein
MTRYFCTYFDRNYLSRGIALYWSLQQTCPSFELWVLCLDSACHKVLSELRLPGIHLIPLEELEESDRQLGAVKSTRSLLEYYFTCSPCLPSFVLSHYTHVDRITYLDADLYFFRDPSDVFDEIEDSSIAIIPHRFHPTFLAREQFGIYNVGWVSFRRDEPGMACLSKWREQCLDWCYVRCEADRFADQKYLDRWPADFSNVAVIQHKGANLAPWNVANYHLRHTESGVCVENDPLIFFHFHYLKQVNKWVYNPGLSEYKTSLVSVLRNDIYVPYIHALRDAEAEVRAVLPPGDIRSRGDWRDSTDEPEAQAQGTVSGVAHSIRNVVGFWRGMVAGDYVVVTHE